MGLPNMSSTVLRFAQSIVRKKVIQSVINHKTVKTFISGEIRATITTPQSQDLQQVEVDTSLEYKLCHTTSELKIDDVFVHKSIEYKVIKLQNREDYGYYRALGEEVQQ